jgi:hypothetical protein
MFYEIRPRKDRRGIDLIGERLPLGVLWFEGPDAIENAVNYARSFSYPHPAIIRVLNESGTLAVIFGTNGISRESKTCCKDFWITVTTDFASRQLQPI